MMTLLIDVDEAGDISRELRESSKSEFIGLKFFL